MGRPCPTGPVRVPKAPGPVSRPPAVHCHRTLFALNIGCPRYVFHVTKTTGVTNTTEHKPTRQAKRRGRRGGGADTREALLNAAREEFRHHGYSGATVRAIAARAGVDPAMVNHWFGSKEGLFTAAMSLPVNLDEVARELIDGDPGLLGERIVRRFLTVWDTAGGSRFVALVHSFASHEQAMLMMRDFIVSVLFARIIKAIGTDQPDLRAALCGSQVFGLGMTRYVMRLEPLASANHDTIVRAIAPNLQRYLTGDIG